jgi:putative flippase GtrA
MRTVFQVAKFIVVGGSNTIVDLGILNLLILFSGFAAGIPFVIFKGISFLLAVSNSYFWNKRWTFASNKEVFWQFLAVSAIGLMLNVAAASLVVNVVGPQFGLSPKIWANVGAITGTLIVMSSNFLGYKFLVFKK